MYHRAPIARSLLSFLALGLSLCSNLVLATPRPLPRSTPEAQGVSSESLLTFLQAADRQIEAMHSIMILRHGHVVAEGWWAPYQPKDPHELYSLSKSFTSTAVGFAVAEGQMSIDDEVLRFFPAEAPQEPSANLKAMRVRDLLTMSAGHQDETASAPDKISPKSFLAHPVPFKPGTHFKYNTPATFMLSAIVQKQAGLPIVDYLRPRLFEPLGIESPVWSTNFQGTSLGGYGLRVRTEDIAKFGQLYLNEGRWQNRQILPRSWVQQATSKQTSNGSNPRSDWDQGYGFQFWRCKNEAYRGDGAFGQYCIVIPKLDAVIAITSGVKDMQSVLDLVWDKALPAFAPKRLKANKPAAETLKSILSNLRVVPAAGSKPTTESEGFLAHRYNIEANDQKLISLSFEPGPNPNSRTLVLGYEDRSVRILFAYGAWIRGGTLDPGRGTEPVASSGGWLDSATLQIKSCAYETPFHVTTTLHFNAGELRIETQPNLSFTNTKRPTLLGRRQASP